MTGVQTCALPIYVISPANPEIIGSVDTPGEAYGVSVSGSYVYVADYKSGLQVIDISNPSSPTITSSVDTPGEAYSVYVSGSYVYVADGRSGLQVIDISTTSNPEIIGSVYTPNSAGTVHISDSYAYVNDGSSGLQVIDISTPSSPEIIGSVYMPSYAQDVYVSGNYVYVADDSRLLVIMPPILIDSNNKNSTTITATVPANLPEGAYNIIVTNPGGDVGTLHNGFRVVDVTPPVISDVEVMNITDTSAVVTWHTDEPSDSVVEFGTTSGEYTDSISDLKLVTSHSLMPADLTVETTYYFVVKSTDSSGNSAQSEEYSFATKKAPGCFISTAADSSVDDTRE